jgi:hypothetical protein
MEHGAVPKRRSSHIPKKKGPSTEQIMRPLIWNTSPIVTAYRRIAMLPRASRAALTQNHPADGFPLYALARQ